MDSTQNASFGQVRRNRKRKAEDSTKKIYFNGPYQYQQWSLPDSLIYYITKKPSTVKAYQKMVQCCKYFFSKNPILIAEQLHISNNGGKLNASLSHNDDHLNVTNASSKFWITGALRNPCQNNINTISPLIPKMFKFEATELSLLGQIISFKELLFITSNVETMNLHKVTVKYDDGSAVPVEQIVEVLPTIKTFSFHTPKKMTSNTMNELMKIPHFSKIDEFILLNVSEVFDLETFYNYMKKNKHTKLYLNFKRSISEAYKNRVIAIANEIMEAENHDYKPAFLDYPGLDKQSLFKMYRLYSN